MNIERQIEFDVIKEQWKKLAVTDQAKEMITEVTCYLAESDLRKQLRDTTNSKIMLAWNASLAERCGGKRDSDNCRKR